MPSDFESKYGMVNEERISELGNKDFIYKEKKEH